MVHAFILASIGGFLIALSTTINLYLKGRVTGFSGIVYALWSREEGSNTWRNTFILGLLTASGILKLSNINSEDFFDSQKTFNKDFSIGAIIISGLLVGFGTKLSNGCTSGHGVCGLPRFNWRSYVAVGVFLFTAMGIATLRYHVPFLNGQSFFESAGISIYESSEVLRDSIYFSSLGLVIFASIIYLFYVYYKEYKLENSREFSDAAVGYLVGLIFGLGLAISGMTKRSRVLGFLTISNEWDASLIFVLGVSVGVNLISFNLILRRTENPIFSNSPCKLKPSSEVTFNFVLGAFLFGVGWGISGLCPGPVMANSLLFLPLTIFFLLMIIIGQFLSNMYVKYIYDKLTNKNKVEGEDKPLVN